MSEQKKLDQVISEGKKKLDWNFVPDAENGMSWKKFLQTLRGLIHFSKTHVCLFKGYD